jgi:hypothetical protein
MMWRMNFPSKHKKTIWTVPTTLMGLFHFEKPRLGWSQVYFFNSQG